MKTSKRLTAAVLTMALTMGLAGAAWAGEAPEVGDPAGGQPSAGTSATLKGSITIDNAVAGQTYTLYQILELESFDAELGAYSYKAAPEWAEWVAGQTGYFSVDEEGYVTWIAAEEDAAAFAKAAQAYAEETGIANKGEVLADGAAVQFADLELGYYLVDTTLGTLCSLDTTQPNVVMHEKNEIPIILKEVQEDSLVEAEGNGWGETNDADMGQTVDFRAVITAYPGAEGYVMHDKFSAGLDFVPESVAIEGLTKIAYTQAEGEEPVRGAGDYEVFVDPACEDGCDFHVVFEQAYLDTIAATTQITVYYSAVVNADAVVAGAGNPNDVKLTYNNEFDTEWDRTVTYTWDMGVLKYANGVEEDVLADAQFVLLNAAKTKAATIVDGKVTGWVEIPAAGEEWPAATVLTTGEDGTIAIVGLDADDYFLREVKAPAGFNKLAEDVAVEVRAASEQTDETGKTTVLYETAIAKVNNQSGPELPSTGGIGTTVFYLVGSVLVLGAVVLLVTRVRMGSKK